METESQTVCIECETEPVDLDGNDDSYWSEIKEARVCQGCHESAYQYASTLHYVKGGEASKVTITDLNITGEYGDPLGWSVPALYDKSTNKDKVKREWKTTDAWRGFYNTTIDGWTAVLTGWTTGGWDDFTGRRKAIFNNWGEELVNAEIIAPCAVAIVADPTSNLFSTAITVFVEDDNVETFKQWLGDDYDDLVHSLS